MPTLDFTLRLITDAFIRGAPGGDLSAEGLRVPSLRGVLRFWYRAKEGTPDTAALYRAESRIFGSTEMGQGVRLIPVHAGRKPTPQPRSQGSRSFDERFLGYGPATDESRRLFPPGSRFAFRAVGSQEHLEELRRCLTLLHLFGGIGGRSRRGWGSVQVEESAIVPPAGEEEDVAPWIGARLASVWSGASQAPGRRSPPRYSAFSSETEIRVFRGANEQDVLSTFAQRFKDRKEDLRKGAAGSGNAPDRVALGLPWHYGKNPTHKYSGHLAGTGKIDRRASPLLLKVLHVPGHGHHGVALALKGPFFGDGKTEMKESRGSGMPKTVSFSRTRAIDDYLADPSWQTVKLP